MIIAEKKNTCIKIGEIKESKFSLNGTGKAFRTLIGNLYSDKVSACLRELGSNQKDAHVEVGKENIPFEITLPNHLEPNLIFRDFGPGIDEDFMLNKYTVAFYSTKSESNDFIGAMGIGRLVALSLSDSYICESFQNGEKKSYSVYLDENGIPSISLLSTQKTDEPDGFKVNISIPKNLINAFPDAAKRVFAHYPVKPIFKGHDDLPLENFEIPENKYVILADDGNWGIKGRGNSSVAIMGTYVYPLDTNSITELSDAQKSLLESGLVVHFNLGELNISANREGLYYDELTINNIKQKLDKVIVELSPKVLSDFVGKDGFERSKFYNSLFNYHAALYSISNLVKDVIKKDHNTKEFIVINDCDFECVNYTLDVYNGKIKKSNVVQIHPNDNTELFYGDFKKHAAARAKKYLEQKVSDGKPQTKMYVLFPKNDKDAALKKLLDEENIDLKNNYTKISTLPFDKVIKTVKSGRKIKTLFFSYCNYGRNMRDNWEDGEHDFENEKCFYVEREGYSIANGITARDLHYHQKIIKEIDPENKDTPILGLTKTQLKDNINNKKCINIYDHTRKIVKNYFKKKSNIKKYAFYRFCLDNYFDRNGWSSTRYEAINESLLTLNCANNSLFTKIIKEYKFIKGVYDEYHHLFESMESLGMKLPRVESKKYLDESGKLKYSFKMIYEYYPLVEGFNKGSHFNSKIKQDLEQYINSKKVYRPKILEEQIS